MSPHLLDNRASILYTPRSIGRSKESGYAYLMALFMVVLLIVGSAVAMQNLLTEGRRQREAEAIWRGQQFTRAIRLYYLKTGHYPQTVDDLKKGMPELHFLRPSAYKDPMNAKDGAWRFIYVNAAGQIIGSVRYATLQQMAFMDLNAGKTPVAQPSSQPGQLGVPVSSMVDQSGISSVGQNTQATSAAPSSGASPNPGENPANSQQGQNPASSNLRARATGANGALANPLTALKPTGPVDGPVLGGFLTGVGSTVDESSVKVYKGGKKYNQWEFIWNPIEDQARAMQQGLSPQGLAPGQPGQPIGTGAAGTSIFGNTGPAASGGANSPTSATAPAPEQPGQPSPQGP